MSDYPEPRLDEILWDWAQTRSEDAWTYQVAILNGYPRQPVAHKIVDLDWEVNDTGHRETLRTACGYTKSSSYSLDHWTPFTRHAAFYARACGRCWRDQ